MKYRLHPQAEQDLAQILDRYLLRFGRQAAKRFLDEYTRIRALVVANPELGTKVSRGRRSYPFKAVPYLLIYRAEEEAGVTILVIRHQHRKPTLGSRRE